MFFSIVASYAVYALVTAFTPGPNNVVALYAISRHGWRKGYKTLVGMTLGFLCVMVICAAGCYELSKYVPALSGVLKYVGAAYILWLAVHVARSRPDSEEGNDVSFRSGLILQFLNVKIIMYAITIYMGYVIPKDPSVISMMMHALMLTVFGVSGNLTWAAAGGFMRNFLSKHYKVFNIVMGIVLAACAVQMLL